MLPTLTENRFLRLSTVTAMYFAQGVQTGLLFTALPAYFAMQEMDAGMIGSFIGILFLPWSFKIISAPIMDRFSFLPMGRRRPWVILGMLGALIGYVAMSLVGDPLNNISGLIAAGMVVSISTAFMDVAIDGMTVDIISDDEYSTANSFMTGGNIIGFASTTALAGILLSKYGISFTMAVIAVLIGLLATFPLLLRERAGERLLPFSKGDASKEALSLQMNSWFEILKNLLAAIIRLESILLLVVVFLFGTTYGLFQTYLPILAVQELDWTDTAFSSLVGAAGLIAGISAMLIASPFMQKVGIKSSIQIFVVALIILSIVMGLIPILWEEAVTMRIFIFSYYGFRTFLLIGLCTLGMMICQKSVAATQFALYMSIVNLGISLGSTIYAPLQSLLSFSQIFFVFALILGILFPIIKRIKKTKPRVLTAETGG